MKLNSKLNKSEILLYAKNLFLVVLGTLILAFGCSIFLFPSKLVTGGVAGIAIVIKGAVESVFPDVHLDNSALASVISWVLFFIGLIVLGWDFSAKTLASTIVFTVSIFAFDLLVSPDVMGGFFDIQSSAHSDVGLIVSSLFSGVCVGTGCALTFLGGGSTGGTDVLAFLICRIFKKVKTSTAVFVTDAVIVLLSMFVLGDFILTLFGVISAWITSMVIDRIFIGSSQAFTANIVSNRYEEINLAIRHEIDRTTTIYTAEGGYSGTEKKVVSVTFSMRQYAALMAIIKRIDKTAFVSISRAHEINGEGWTYGIHE